MPQTKETFLKGRTTQFLMQQLRRHGLSFFDENFDENTQGISDYLLQNILDWKTGKMREVILIYDNSQTHGNNSQTRGKNWSYTLGELKDELDKRPHISHHRERRKPHKFPANKRKHRA